MNRVDGSVVWEQSLPSVNYVVGVNDGIILCATIRAGWRSGSGACALRLNDGKVIWSDALSPVSLKDGTFLCMDGSVRDLPTARIVRQQPALGEFAPLEARRSSDLGLELDLGALRKRSLQLAPGVFVTGHTQHSDYSAATREGEAIWRYSLKEAGWHCGRSGVDHFVSPPYIFMLVSASPTLRQIDGSFFERIPTRRHLLALDIRSGAVVQELDLGVWRRCAINDVDDDGAVLTFEKTHLAYHRRLQ